MKSNKKIKIIKMKRQKIYLILLLISLIAIGLALEIFTRLEHLISGETTPALKTSSPDKIERIINETQVNKYISNWQYLPKVCALSSDTLAVAWESDGQDGDGYGVYATVIEATTGNNITAEFQVNEYTTGDQVNPSICALSSDTFAAAWRSEGQDGDGYGVYATVIDATTGNNITTEFQVNEYTTSNQLGPSICALSSEIFAIA